MTSKGVILLFTIYTIVKFLQYFTIFGFQNYDIGIINFDQTRIMYVFAMGNIAPYYILHLIIAPIHYS